MKSTPPAVEAGPKPLRGDAAVIRALAALTPGERLARAFELSAFTRDLFRAGLRRSRPDATDDDINRLYLARLALCHNRNY